MDVNCGEWVECMGVASWCGEQEAGVTSWIGWNLWVWLLGVVVRRYMISSYYLSLLLLYLFFFAAASLLLFIFSFLSVFFVIIFYVLNKFFMLYKHTYGQLRASHMKAAHTVLYMKTHTQTYASYPAMDISCISVV